MSDNLNKIFGIDLGTTFSCIAYVDEHGKPVIIPNFDGNRTTPSVVFFDESNVIVGEEAKNSLPMYPDKISSFVKKDMGDTNFIFNANGNTYTPEEISSYILRKLAKDAEQNIGESVKDVVITCPADFGINEREATRKAGEIAGLNVKAIINEPTAAAIAYGLEKGEDKVVLVYDLGGGTFDITMIEITEVAIKVIVTGGDRDLGGKNWDDTIIGYLAECFKEETGIEVEEILDDKETAGELRLSAEKAKKALTQRPKTSINITHAGERVKVELTKEKFEELTSGLLERTIELTKIMLDEAKEKGYEKYDEFILVGGSTKMPQIKDRIDQEFSIDAKSFDPDESVAKGAAVYGWQTSLNDELKQRIADSTGKDIEQIDLDTIEVGTIEEAQKEIAEERGLSLGEVKKAKKEIINVTSRSFGIIAIDKNDQEKLYNLIMINEAVPYSITQPFGTHKDNQNSVQISILESFVKDKEVSPEEGKEIGEAILDLPSGLAAGSPIEVTFIINEEGRLDVKARETSENREVATSIQTASVISGEELETAKERSKGVVVL